ncbi:response regulator [bacterium]|nr:response regulator [bacterium]
MKGIIEESKIEPPATVLVVEDDEGLNRLIQKKLRRADFCVEGVSNGADAIARVVDNRNTILLLDYLLPDMTGKEVIEALAKRKCSVPVIMMTGHGDEKIAVEMMKLGTKDYIVKDQNFINILPRIVKKVYEERNKEQRLVRAEEALRISHNFLRIANKHTEISLLLKEFMAEVKNYTGCVAVGIRTMDEEGNIPYQAYQGFCQEFYESESPLSIKSDQCMCINVIKGEIDAKQAFYTEYGSFYMNGTTLSLATVSEEEKGQTRNVCNEFGYESVALVPIRRMGNRILGLIHVADTRENMVPLEKVKVLEGVAMELGAAIQRMYMEEELRNSNRRLEETLAELRATQQQIIRQERLRALGQLASGIAHDFNNNLTPILGFTDLLLDSLESLDDKESVRYYLTLINTAAKDASNVVSRLREFYRHREEDEIITSVNINQLVKQTIELTQPKWKDQAQANSITIDIEADLQEVPLISGNEEELREVLTNLILNAVDAMPKNGTITLRTRFEGKQVVLEVSDTGVGMTEEVKQRCFEPFFSTKQERGTGLGLAMVYGIINRGKGTIEILSEPGRGTTFIINLPIQIKQQVKERGKETEVPLRSLHVLVVDDETMVRDVVTKYLTADGHTVETATNGREGLEKFHSGRFHLVITDRAMPDMGGVQLAALIKQLAPKMPIIMLTGFGDIMAAQGTMPEGVDFLLSKPITLTAFREALAEFLKQD